MPSKFIAPLSQGFSDSHRTKSIAENLQVNFEILSRCIKENFGFKDGKPTAACVIYIYLLHWHSFDSERTAYFDFVIENINDVMKSDLSSSDKAKLPHLLRWFDYILALKLLRKVNDSNAKKTVQETKEAINKEAGLKDKKSDETLRVRMVLGQLLMFDNASI